jgi:mannose-6-phosphate isomerase-like protein (cupin superfamily)
MLGPMTFESKRLPVDVDAVAPDGSNVRLLLTSSRGGLAHFQLAGDQVSVAVRHRTVDELWYFIAGQGEMWLSDSHHSCIVAVSAGTSINIPVGTSFQFRATSNESLAAIGVTMPPWPGDGEAIHVADGPWQPTVTPGSGLASS